MIGINIECVDAGSNYCPCCLAELNECISCSLLQGKDFCDCNWQGICIYQEYAWRGFKVSSGRKTILTRVMERRWVCNNILILTLEVPHKMASELKEPGSFVFIRGYSDSSFDTPISIMHTDEHSVKLTVKIRGPKTKLIEKCRDGIYLRGPYWNGILGLKYIKSTRYSRCLVVLSGIAQASGVQVIENLIKNNNDVTVLIDNTDVIFIREYLNGMRIYEEDISSEEGQKLIKELISDKNISLIYSGGSNKQHRNIIDFAKRYNPRAYIAVSNNNRLCCGEGVCGSCEVNINGHNVRSCKAQFDVRWLKWL